MGSQLRFANLLSPPGYVSLAAGLHKHGTQGVHRGICEVSEVERIQAMGTVRFRVTGVYQYIRIFQTNYNFQIFVGKLLKENQRIQKNNTRV